MDPPHYPLTYAATVGRRRRFASQAEAAAYDEGWRLYPAEPEREAFFSPERVATALRAGWYDAQVGDRGAFNPFEDD